MIIQWCFVGVNECYVPDSSLFLGLTVQMHVLRYIKDWV